MNDVTAGKRIGKREEQQQRVNWMIKKIEELFYIELERMREIGRDQKYKSNARDNKSRSPE